MTFYIVGYKIKWNDNVIRVCGGFVETLLLLWYYRNIRKISVIAEEFFVNEDNLP